MQCASVGISFSGATTARAAMTAGYTDLGLCDESVTAPSTDKRK